MRVRLGCKEATGDDVRARAAAVSAWGSHEGEVQVEENDTLRKERWHAAEQFDGC